MAGAKEELHTFDLTKEVGFTSCSSISDSSCDANTPRSHCSRGSVAQTKRSSQAGWTDEEDTMLTEVVKKYNGRNWKKIAESIPGRSDVQCLHRWQKVLNPELVKGPWTKEEDDRIKDLVEKHGCKKWSLIAKHLAGRIGKQCRERTDNAIKNHWNSSKRRLDLNIPPVFPTRTASPELRKRSREISLNEQNGSNTCSTNLALGNPKSGTGTINDDNLGFSRYAKVRKLEPSDSCLTMSETPKRAKTDSMKDLKLANSPDSSFLSLSTFGYSEGNSKLVSGTPSYSSLCYQPPQLKNLAISLENTHFACSTPPDLALSISVSSPESILRNSAMSFKNTPSIIRKRTPRKAVGSHDCSKNVDTMESENGKCGSESWLHRSQPSLGRRLDYMFDSEWDPTMVRCGTPGSVTPSSKPNVMLTP
ncbi:hypothetical protein L1887_29108 [Cichorium endivia]|nr:hypothetical protein L1887_29108 [Cichorium endivia]